MAAKIDPLNKKLYGSVTAMLTVTDIKAAAAFYQKAFGFAKRAIMNGPDGKAIHAELTLRGTTFNVGAGNAADGFPQRESGRCLADEFVSADGKRGQDGCQSRKARRHAQGRSDGYVLGRPLWSRSRSRGLPLDGRYPHGATHAEEMQQKMKEEMASRQAARAASGS